MHHPSSIRTALERSGRVTELAIKHLIVWASQALVLLDGGRLPAIVVSDYTDAFIVIWSSRHSARYSCRPSTALR